MSIRKVMGFVLRVSSLHKQLRKYYCRFKKYAFIDCKCKSYEQYRSSIIRLYHTIEKGLSYEDYRPGFGKENVDRLISSMEQYSQDYDISSFFYETALDCLYKYIQKNEEFGYRDEELKSRILNLQGKPNGLGGTSTVKVPLNNNDNNFEEMITSRRSIRHFSDKPVDVESLIDAVHLAQYTPSACNRQGWKTRIISDAAIIKDVLSNQNGNRGFGQEINKLLVITADLRAQQKNRELFQAYIDGGMYAENILNSLYYKGIGAVPLSASLTYEQEKNVRRIIKIHDAEVLILFIGVGNYPERNFKTTRSEREIVKIEII